MEDKAMGKNALKEMLSKSKGYAVALIKNYAVTLIGGTLFYSI